LQSGCAALRAAHGDDTPGQKAHEGRGAPRTSADYQGRRASQAQHAAEHDRRAAVDCRQPGIVHALTVEVQPVATHDGHCSGGATANCAVASNHYPIGAGADGTLETRVGSGLYSKISPGWHCNALQIASNVDSRIALALPFFKTEMLAIVMPTFSASSVTLIF